MARTYPLPTMRAARTGQRHSHVGDRGPTHVVDGLGDRRQGRPADAAVVVEASPTFEDWTRRQRSRTTSVPTLASARASAWTACEGINAGRSSGVIAHGTRCITPEVPGSGSPRRSRLSAGPRTLSTRRSRASGSPVTHVLSGQ